MAKDYRAVGEGIGMEDEDLASSVSPSRTGRCHMSLLLGLARAGDAYDRGFEAGVVAAEADALRDPSVLQSRSESRALPR